MRQKEVRELLIRKDMELTSERIRNCSSRCLGKLMKETINTQSQYPEPRFEPVAIRISGILALFSVLAVNVC